MMQMVAAHNSATSGSTMDSISPLALRHNLMSKWQISLHLHFPSLIVELLYLSL